MKTVVKIPHFQGNRDVNRPYRVVGFAGEKGDMDFVKGVHCEKGKVGKLKRLKVRRLVDLWVVDWLICVANWANRVL